MKVEASILGAVVATPASGSRSSNQEDFQSVLDSALSATACSPAQSKPMSAAEKARKAEEADVAAREAFLSYMKKPPLQRMREAILKELGLTEEGLRAMAPEQRAAAEAAIAEKIKERLMLQAQETRQQAA